MKPNELQRRSLQTYVTCSMTPAKRAAGMKVKRSKTENNPLHDCNPEEVRR